MSTTIDWWTKPRKISVIVDNQSWIIPYAKKFCDGLNNNGDHAFFCSSYEDIQCNGIAFYFGCINITPPDILARNQRNLVVHASDLPEGRGFSPLTWQVIAGKNAIPVCLIEAVEEVDAGPVIDRQELIFHGHELIDEMRCRLGEIHLTICSDFLKSNVPPSGTVQLGKPSYYKRRKPSDSWLNAEVPISEQFDLLRTVDNNKYPAFLDIRGHRYKLTIEKINKVTVEL